MFDEPVAVADLLRLALDGHLKLSVNFVNHAQARCGKVVPYEEVKWREIPAELVKSTINLPDEAHGQTISVMSSINIDGKRFINLSNDITTISGTWDLPMIGSETLDIEQEYQNLTGGPSVTLVCLEGAFVEDQNGQICQLQEHFSDNEYCKDKSMKNPYSHPDNYYPAGSLPSDSVLVVRVEALSDLQKQLLNDEALEEKPLTVRAETTYLNIIGALLELMLGRTPTGKPYSAFENQTAIISALLAQYGGKPGISARTLDEKFAAAKRNLKTSS